MRRNITIAVVIALFVMGGLLLVRPYNAGSPGPTGAVSNVSSLDQMDKAGSGMVLRPVIGIDVDFLESREDGRKVVYERYRLFDTTNTYQGEVGPEGNVNISSENARMFLKSPAGMMEEVTSEFWWYAHEIFPGLPEGRYELTIELNSGEVFVFELYEEGGRETRLEAAQKTVTQQKPILTPDSDPKKVQLHNDLEAADKESRVLTAFGLEGVNLFDADVLYHIDAFGVPYGAQSPTPEDEGFFWIDLAALGDLQKRADDFQREREAFQLLSESERGLLSEKEIDFLSGEQTDLSEHVFMARVEGTWIYATAIFPEDFK